MKATLELVYEVDVEDNVNDHGDVQMVKMIQQMIITMDLKMNEDHFDSCNDNEECVPCGHKKLPNGYITSIFNRLVNNRNGNGYIDFESLIASNDPMIIKNNNKP